ncbi:hypothetical protein STENM223S_09193 [Streptomyces tendae]
MKAGAVEQRTEPGSGAAARRVLSLTRRGPRRPDGPAREPKDVEITDGQRFFTLLAFLRFLPDPAAQAAVLRSRKAFLDAPSSFFHRDGEPMRAEEAPDPFRQGMLRIARATTVEQRAWPDERPTARRGPSVKGAPARPLGSCRGVAGRRRRSACTDMNDTVARVYVRGYGTSLCATGRAARTSSTSPACTAASGAESDIETLAARDRGGADRAHRPGHGHARRHVRGRGARRPDGTVVRRSC